MQSAPPQVEPADLNLLRAWREPVTPRRLAPAVIGSLLVHAVIIVLAIFTPDTPAFTSDTQILSNFEKPTILYDPPRQELTQKAPNVGKVLKQLDLRSAVQAQPSQAPHPRYFTPPPGPPAPGPDPKTLNGAQIDAPQLQTGLDTPLPALGATSGIAGVQSIGAAPKPNSTAQPKPAAPKPDPLREALRAGGGGVTVGDLSEASPGARHRALALRPVQRPATAQRPEQHRLQAVPAAGAGGGEAALAVGDPGKRAHGPAGCCRAALRHRSPRRRSAVGIHLAHGHRA